MADTQTRDEIEHRQSTALDSRESVEVFDTNGAAAHRQAEKLNGDYNSAPINDAVGADAGFGHADLRKADVIHGDGDTIAFRSTDLRNSELNSADFTTARQPNLADSQGTNWGTILMVIALILVIILIGSWLF